MNRSCRRAPLREATESKVLCFEFNTSTCSVSATLGTCEGVVGKTNPTLTSALII
jgi:hypothetical protein